MDDECYQGERVHRRTLGLVLLQDRSTSSWVRTLDALLRVLRGRKKLTQNLTRERERERERKRKREKEDVDVTDIDVMEDIDVTDIDVITHTHTHTHTHSRLSNRP